MRMTPAHTIHAHDTAEHLDVPIETVSGVAIESRGFCRLKLSRVDEEMTACGRGRACCKKGTQKARVGPSILIASGGIRWLGRGSS